MIPISEEDRKNVEALLFEVWDSKDTGTPISTSLYRIAKAAIEFNKTAAPVFHIAEEDRNLVIGINPEWAADPESRAGIRIAKAAIDAQAKVKQNAPKLTDINWAGLCDEKVWETQLSQGHWGNATRGRWIAEQFRTCRDFAFSRHPSSSDELDRLKQQNRGLQAMNDRYRESLSVRDVRLDALERSNAEFHTEILALRQQLATVKEQANKPKVIRKF